MFTYVATRVDSENPHNEFFPPLKIGFIAEQEDNGGNEKRTIAKTISFHRTTQKLLSLFLVRFFCFFHRLLHRQLRISRANLFQMGLPLLQMLWCRHQMKGRSLLAARDAVCPLAKPCPLRKGLRIGISCA